MIEAKGKISAILGMTLLLSIQAFAGSEGRILTQDAVQKTFGERCKVVRQCGDLSYIDCDSMTDGPAYYVRTATLEVVMNCGGYCMAPKEDMKDKNCVQCPPEQWTCKD